MRSTHRAEASQLLNRRHARQTEIIAKILQPSLDIGMKLVEVEASKFKRKFLCIVEQKPRRMTVGRSPNRNYPDWTAGICVSDQIGNAPVRILPVLDRNMVSHFSRLLPRRRL